MFKRTLLISALVIGASLSVTPSFAAPSSASVSGLASCSGSACVAQAQALLADINTMQAGPAKDKLLLALVKSIGAVAIANPELSVSLGNVAAGAESGLSAAAAPAAAIVAQVVTALRAGTPGEATAAIGGPGLGGDTGGGDDDGLGNSSAS